MAKRKTTPSRRTVVSARQSSPRRVKKKGGNYRSALLAIGILLALVILAAVAMRFLWPVRPVRPVPPAAVRPPAAVVAKVPQPPPAPVRPQTVAPSPTYEIFPPREAPPQKRVPPVTPPAGRPRVALVIDDLGYDLALAEGFLALDAPLTVAVLPFSPHKQTVLDLARRHGKPVMLHLPMEPEEYPRVQPGPGALLATMTPDELLIQLRRNLQDVPAAVGVNNHMGSRLSQDSARLNQIFSVLKERGLFFIDSRTTDKTLAHQSARLLQVPFAQRDVFLDHHQDATFIRHQIEALIDRAEENGQAVGIGHPHPVTLEVLRERLPAIRQRVDLVPASAVVRTLY